jgi:rod shape-determining protein MreB
MKPVRLGLFSAGFGIDLGTANTVVCRPSGTVVLNEPSVMVVRADDHHEAVLIGSEARELLGRTPVGMMTVRPIRDGVITDLETARAFIVSILRRVTRRPWERVRPRAVVGVPSGATTLERRALIEAVEEAGVGRVDLVPEPIVGAVGCGIDPLSRRAHMVIDIGGGTAEMTAFCFGGILANQSTRIAGDEMTLAIHQYLRQKHQMVVGELTAEDVKMRLRQSPNGSNPLMVEGRDLVSGRPSVLALDTDEVAEALRPTVDGIVDALGACLADLPPQASGDIMQDGVLVFGGGSLLQGFDSRLEEAFGLSVSHAKHPLTCVAEGAAAALSQPAVVAAYGTR